MNERKNGYVLNLSYFTNDIGQKEESGMSPNKTELRMKLRLLS